MGCQVLLLRVPKLCQHSRSGKILEKSQHTILIRAYSCSVIMIAGYIAHREPSPDQDHGRFPGRRVLQLWAGRRQLEQSR